MDTRPGRWHHKPALLQPPSYQGASTIVGEVPSSAVDPWTTSQPDVTDTMTYNTASQQKPGRFEHPESHAQQPQNYVTRLRDLDDWPSHIDCPYCRTRQETRVERKRGDRAL